MPQVVPQVPAPHTWPDEHTVGQAPQWALSVCRFTQVVPQSVWPDGHAQVPAWHDWPLVQAWPQAAAAVVPQLLLSVSGLTQVPEQLTWPMPQVVAHTPAEHAVPAPHTRLQAPQLLLSVCMFTQALPQAVWPVGHAQAPDWHDWPLVHAWPHAVVPVAGPQLLLSVSGLTQLPEQIT